MREVRIRDRNDIPRFQAALDEAEGKKVEVGFPGDTQESKSLAGIAAANEFGTLRIPSRSFIRPSFDDNETPKKLSQVLQRLLTGVQPKAVNDLLDGLGVSMVAIIRKRIRSNIPPPNAARTIARKKSARTLIDTGRMLQGVTYKVS